MVSALESMADQISKSYIPMGVEHDPRVPPIGRIVAARVKELEDGEYGLEADIEMFEPGDDLELQTSARELAIKHYSEDLEIGFDRNFSNVEDQVAIREIGKLFGSAPTEEAKKSVDPISLLTIGGAFVLGGVTAGFLSKIGEDGYEFLKKRLSMLLQRRKSGGSEKLFRFQAVVKRGDYEIEVNVLLSDPTEDGIDEFFRNGLTQLDSVLPQYFEIEGLKSLVLEYSERGLVEVFGVRRDAVPLKFSRVRKPIGLRNELSSGVGMWNATRTPEPQLQFMLRLFYCVPDGHQVACAPAVPIFVTHDKPLTKVLARMPPPDLEVINFQELWTPLLRLKCTSKTTLRFGF